MGSREQELWVAEGRLGVRIAWGGWRDLAPPPTLSRDSAWLLQWLVSAMAFEILLFLPSPLLLPVSLALKLFKVLLMIV